MFEGFGCNPNQPGERLRERWVIAWSPWVIAVRRRSAVGAASRMVVGQHWNPAALVRQRFVDRCRLFSAAGSAATATAPIRGVTSGLGSPCGERPLSPGRDRRRRCGHESRLDDRQCMARQATLGGAGTGAAVDPDVRSVPERVRADPREADQRLVLTRRRTGRAPHRNRQASCCLSLP